MLNMQEKGRRQGMVVEGSSESSTSKGLKEAANVMLQAIRTNDAEMLAKALKSAISFLEMEGEMSKED